MPERRPPAFAPRRLSLILPALALMGAGSDVPPVKDPGAPATVQVAAADKAPEFWAGHEILLGHVDLPLLGKIETRTDNYVIARVTREGDTYRLVQSACGSHTKPVLGSSVTLPEGTITRLPPTNIEYRRTGSALIAPAWTSGWGSEDVDGDGHPGVTYDVKAPLCGGQIYAAVHNVAVARAHEGDGGHISGEVK